MVGCQDGARKDRAMSKSKLCHMAFSVDDPFETSELYEQAFGMEEAGQTDLPLSRGVYLSEGTPEGDVSNTLHEEKYYGPAP